MLDIFVVFKANSQQCQYSFEKLLYESWTIQELAFASLKSMTNPAVIQIQD